MKISIYQVDAFANRVFAGNPAAVCMLEEWLSDALLQKIAMENNLSETAFIVPSGDDYKIRWFTPAVEVALCGHATLASAYVLFNCMGYDRPEVRFLTNKSGWLTVTRDNDLLTLDFPADPPAPTAMHEDLVSCLNIAPRQTWKGKTDLLLVYNAEADIKGLSPDLTRMAQLDARGIIVTAPGEQVDFVSRFFAPRVGVPEDPVTGSAHTLLIPYWAKQLGKQEMTALQLSARGGELFCRDNGARVGISGRATLYMTGEITVPDESL